MVSSGRPDRLLCPYVLLWWLRRCSKAHERCAFAQVLLPLGSAIVLLHWCWALLRRWATERARVLQRLKLATSRRCYAGERTSVVPLRQRLAPGAPSVRERLSPGAPQSGSA